MDYESVRSHEGLVIDVHLERAEKRYRSKNCSCTVCLHEKMVYTEHETMVHITMYSVECGVNAIRRCGLSSAVEQADTPRGTYVDITFA